MTTEKTQVNNQLYDIWLLNKIKGEELVFARQLMLEINTEKLSFLGNANCNRIFGELNLNKNLVNFKNIGATRMACDELNLENDYLALLQNVKSFQIKNMRLLLFNEKGNLILEYQKVD